MKMAFSGKGGVGKTTLSALMIYLLSRQGHKVLAVDADSNPSLAAALGFPEPDKITPVVRMKKLIEERLGTSQSGGLYSLTPKVDDIPEKFTRTHQGIKLIVMGAIERGGSGCACPQNSFLKALLGQILCQIDETIVIDMEAGLEQLGRGTAQTVDHLLIVAESGSASIRTAKRIYQLAGDLKIKNRYIIANKVQNESDITFITEAVKPCPVIGSVPYSEDLIKADRKSDSSVFRQPHILDLMRQIARHLSLF